MKRTILLVCAVVVAAWAGAQEVAPQQSQAAKSNPWTLNLSVNLSAWQQLGMYEDWGFKDVVPGGTTSHDLDYIDLMASIDLTRHVVDWFSLGMRTTIGYRSYACYDSRGASLGTVRQLPITIVLAGKATYYKGRAFELYGNYGLGACFGLNVTDYYWRPRFGAYLYDLFGEFYPVCMNFGHKRGLFAELGFGSKGIANVGFFTTF